jgi:hypothetical protein
MFITSYFSHKDGDQEEIPILQRRAFNIQRNEDKLRALGLLSSPKKKTMKTKRTAKKKIESGKPVRQSKRLVSLTHQYIGYPYYQINILLSIFILYDNLQTKSTTITTSDQPSRNQEETETPDDTKFKQQLPFVSAETLVPVRRVLDILLITSLGCDVLKHILPYTLTNIACCL